MAYSNREFIAISRYAKLLKSIKIFQSYDRKCTATFFMNQCTSRTAVTTTNENRYILRKTVGDITRHHSLGLHAMGSIYNGSFFVEYYCNFCVQISNP